MNATVRVRERWGRLDAFDGVLFLLLAAGFVAVVAFLLLPHSALSDVVLRSGVVALCAVVATAATRRRGYRRPQVLASLALGLFLVGEVVWQVIGPDVYPSAADLARLSAYVALGLAAVSHYSTGRNEVDRAVWLDAAILALAAGLSLWVFVMEPVVMDSSSDAGQKAMSLAYPLAGLLVLGLLFPLVFAPTGRSGQEVLLMAGVVALVATDVASGALSGFDGYAAGSALDPGWLLACLLIAAACVALHGPQRVGPVADPGWDGNRLPAVVLAIVTPQVVLLVALQGIGRVGLNTLTLAVVVSSVMITLVAVRLWTLLGEARRDERHRGERRLAGLVKHSSDAFVLLDDEGRITYASPAVDALWCRDPDQAVGTPIESWFPADEQPGFSQLMRNITASQIGEVTEFGGEILVEPDVLRHFQATAQNRLSDPDIRAVVVTMRDVTVQRELEVQLRSQAFRDPLTGLANRTLFADRVDQAIRRLARAPEAVAAVLFIDLDLFKAVNDGMGHSAGDELLRQVGVRIRGCLRSGDTAARFGGDEFAVLVESMPSTEGVTRLAERVLAALREPVLVNDVAIGVTASIGVALLTSNSTIEAVLRDADIAMYSAKARGRGRVELFHSALRRVAEERLALRVELPRALERDELVVAYQPICEVSSRRVSGYEALVRWSHPRRGVVYPAEFIAEAEETGLILDLGRWVLREACRQARVWNDRSGQELGMSVNVSAVQIHHPSFLSDVEAAVRDAGLQARLLTLEVTESLLIDTERVIGVLQAIRELGVSVAIDDFGTGYSSLSYLQHLPINGVKIDRTFTRRLARSDDDGLFRSILTLAGALGMVTVAEGVEAAGQLEKLEALGCPLAQGFYLGYPRTPEDDELLLPNGQIDEPTNAGRR